MAAEDCKLSRRAFLSASGLAAGTALTGCAMLQPAAPIPALTPPPPREATLKRHDGPSYIDHYRDDACLECGLCLYECLFKDLDIAESVEGIRRLRRGDNVDDLLDACTFCYKCNNRCPVHAHPTGLMLERLRDRRERDGVPPSLAYVVNDTPPGEETRDNLFADMFHAFNPEERNIVEGWAEPKQSRDLIWCGCGVRALPLDIENSAVLGDCAKFGGVSDCCGLFAARSGQYETASRMMERLVDRLHKCRFDRLVIICGSCQEMLTKLGPEYLGMEFPFKTISAFEYIEERMNSGKAQIQRTVNREAVLSDSCFGYELGNDYLSCIDRLAGACGYSLSEMEHRRDNNACCGLGGYFRDGNILDPLKASRPKHADLTASTSSDVLTYCQGCFLGMLLLHGGFMPCAAGTHYLLEDILWSLGDDIRTPNRSLPLRLASIPSAAHMLKIAPSALL